MQELSDIYQDFIISSPIPSSSKTQSQCEYSSSTQSQCEYSSSTQSQCEYSSNIQSRCESSFDSGYCASPTRTLFSNFTSWPLTNSPFRMDPKMAGRQPLSPQKIVKTDAAGGYILISPHKNNNPASSFSPFKNSTLSPFKLINQSPSKGSFDDWDKDFIASFEENLFGIHDVGDLSESIVGELMKSPQGKAFLEKRNSPLRTGSRKAARKLKISPRSQTSVSRSVIVDVGKSGAVATPAVLQVKEEPIEFYTIIKPEPLNETELNNEHNYHTGNVSALSATDPNKMNATPIKPSLIYDNKVAPKRKLSMKEDKNPACRREIQPQSPILQNENSVPAALAFHQWPAKDRLKFARAHFRQILDKAVKEKLDSLATLKHRFTSKDQEPKIDLKVKFTNKKHSKRKSSRKTGKREKYPQIKKALSKPSVTAPVFRMPVHNPVIPHIPKKEPAYDPGWYPDEDIDTDDADDDITWTGPMPFQRQLSQGFHGEDDGDDEDVYVDIDMSSDDEYFPSVVNKKRKVQMKGFGRKRQTY